MSRAYKSSLSRRPTCVYRAFIGDRLAYVGITQNPRGRYAQHSSSKPWWPSVTSVTEEWFDRRSEAMRAEVTAIHHESPLHNIARPAVLNV